MDFRGGQPNPFGQPVFYGVPGVPVGKGGCIFFSPTLF
jgi:hypothetical protein